MCVIKKGCIVTLVSMGNGHCMGNGLLYELNTVIPSVPIECLDKLCLGKSMRGTSSV